MVFHVGKVIHFSNKFKQTNNSHAVFQTRDHFLKSSWLIKACLYYPRILRYETLNKDGLILRQLVGMLQLSARHMKNERSPICSECDLLPAVEFILLCCDKYRWEALNILQAVTSILNNESEVVRKFIEFIKYTDRLIRPLVILAL